MSIQNSKAYLVGLFILSLICTIMVLRLWSHNVESTNTNELTSAFLKNRLHYMVDYLEASPQENNLNVFWGASEIETGIDPIYIDKDKNQTSLNLGLRVGHPELFIAQAKRVKEIFARKGQKVRHSIIKVPLARMTESYAGSSYYKTDILDLLSQVDSKDMMIERLKNEPQQILGYLSARYIWQDANLGSVRTKFRQAVGLSDEVPAILEANFEIWKQPEYLENPAWNKEQRGFYNFNRPQTELAYRALQPRLHAIPAQDAIISFHQSCCDILGLGPSDQMINSYADFITEIQSFSDKVSILYFPESPYLESRRSEESKKNKEKILQELSVKTGAAIINAENNLNFQTEDYIDAIHLSDQGSKKIMNWLASQL